MKTGARYSAVDALRGLIMIIMALDHSSAFVARQHSSEFWSGAMTAYTSAFPFLTRFVTHVCAPGFFFLMGAGIYWFAASAPDLTAAMRRTVKRGFLLFAIAQVLEAPVMVLQSLLKPAAVSLSLTTAPPPNDGTQLYWGLITLSGLGMVMIVCGLLLRARPWIWLLVSALCIFATNSLLPANGQPGAWWMAVLLAPGIAQHLVVIYPLIPWLAGAAAGLYFGYWWRSNPDTAARRVWLLGLILLAAGLALRAAGGWGNIRPPRDTGWIEFLNNVKYPPSLVFWAVSLGLDLLILGALTRLPRLTSGASPLMVFGQTPLFFYLLHFFVFVAAAFAFFREAGSLEMAYIAWIVVVAVLYPICAWYRRFKLAKHRESAWRMF